MADYTKARIELLPEYGLTPSDVARGRQLKDIPWDWRLRFPQMRKRYNEAAGWTDDQIGLMTPGWAAHEDWVWGTSGLVWKTPDGKPFLSGSRRGVGYAPCSMAVTHPMTRAFGIYEGLTVSHPANAGGFEVDIWDEKWVYMPGLELQIDRLGPQVNKIKAAFVSTTFGGEGTITAYNEMSVLRHVFFRFSERAFYTPGELRVGSVGWDLGTNSADGFLHTHNADAVVMYVRGTPVNIIGPLTCMNGNVTGIIFAGTALNTFNQVSVPGDDGIMPTWAGLEVDDCPSAFLVVPGFGREAGGRAFFSSIKVENSVSPGRDPAGGIIGEIDGQFMFHCPNINFASAGVKVDSLFVLNPVLKSGSTQRSYLRAFITGFGYENVLQDNVNRFKMKSPGDYNAYRVEWDDSGTVSSNRTLTKISGTSTKRLGFLTGTGSFDHIGGTPAYRYDGPQGSGGTVTPPPPPPPATGVLKYIDDNGFLTPANAKDAKSGKVPAPAGTNVTRMVINNLKFASVPTDDKNYWVNDVMWIYKGSLNILDGGVRPLQLVKAGTPVNIDVKWNSPRAITTYVGPVTGQSAATFGCTRYEVYA